MTLLLIFTVLLALISAVFALQNAIPVAVVFLSWRFDGSLAVVILGSILIGVVMTLLILIPILIKKNWTISRLRSAAKASTPLAGTGPDKQ